MRKVLLSLAVLALSVPAFAENKAVKIGDKAPTFSGIPAVAPNGEQTSVSLPDLKEDVVVLVSSPTIAPPWLHAMTGSSTS